MTANVAFRTKSATPRLVKDLTCETLLLLDEGDKEVFSSEGVMTGPANLARGDSAE
jgi:hypothetical protein